MSDVELLGECQLLLLRLSVITGWAIPQSELKNILIENLCRKMVESYPNVNVSEVEYAFRNKSLKTVDWGKSFSLTLLDEVMIPFLEKRYSVSDMEQRIKQPPTQKIYTDEEILNQRREEIEKAFQSMKKGYYPLLHVYFEDVLKGDGLLGEYEQPEFLIDKKYETIGEFFVRKLNSSADHIYEKEC